MREARHISREVEKKANQANRRADDIELSKRKVEEKTNLLEEGMKWLESELSKARGEIEARLSVEKKKHEGELEAVKIDLVQAFKSLTEFLEIKLEFASLSYIQGVEDFKEKVRNHFSDLNFGFLESDSEEEVHEVEDEVRVEDLFSLAREYRAVEERMPAPPPTVIILSNHAEADESLIP